MIILILLLILFGLLHAVTAICIDKQFCIDLCHVLRVDPVNLYNGMVLMLATNSIVEIIGGISLCFLL